MFCQWESSFDNGFFIIIIIIIYYYYYYLVDEGREDPSTTISGPSSTRQRNAIKWRFAGVPMMAQHWMLAWQLCGFQGIQNSIAKKPYIFCEFSDPPPPSHPLDPHMCNFTPYLVAAELPLMNYHWWTATDELPLIKV